MSKIPISIVIAHYKTEASTLSLVKELSQVAEIIIIDNSQSKTLKSALDKFPNCHLIANKINTGFSHACNQGLLLSKNRHALFLNSDLEINETQIEQLLTELKKENLTAISPTFLNNKGQIDLNYRKPIPTPLSLLIEFSSLNKLFKQSTSQSTLAGACLLVNKDQFLKLEAWDERFFIWFEDSDLSKRLLRGNQSFSITDKVRIRHSGGESFQHQAGKWRVEVFFHSLRIFTRKHFLSCHHRLLKKITHRFSQNKLYPQNKNIRASIVVPNLKGELLDKFLQNNYRFFDFSQDELIIVSSAGQKWELRKKYPDVLFIYLNKNKGFASTVNIGLNRATGKWIGTINDDVILEKNWLKNLINEAKLYPQNHIGSISPIIRSLNGKIETFGVDVLKQGKALKNTVTDQRYKKSNAFNGAAVLFNREALSKIGLFDEKFGSYLEDLDLGLRIQKKGYLNLATNKVKITHLGQQTSKQIPIKKAWLDAKNWWLITLKHTGWEEWLKFGDKISLERLRNLSGLGKAIYSKIKTTDIN